jgi:hypothetical protein
MSLVQTCGNIDSPRPNGRRDHGTSPGAVVYDGKAVTNRPSEDAGLTACARDGDVTYSASFPDRGVFAFACTLHPGMTGSIVVGDGAQAATAGFVEPVAASAPAPDTDNWVPAAAIGLLIGAAAGAGIVRLRGDRAVPASDARELEA